MAQGRRVGKSRVALAGRDGEAMGRAVMEPLEGRALLAAVAWDGGGGDGLWSNALNWSGDVAPAFADDVTIDLGGAQRLVVADAGPVRVRSLTLDETLVVNSGVVVNASGGIWLTANADLRINGLVNWSSGTWETDTTVRVQPGGRLNIGSSAQPDAGAVTLRSHVDNKGLLAWQGGTVSVASTGAIINNPGKRFDIAAQASLRPEVDSVGLLVNAGVVRRGGASDSASVIDIDLVNATTGLISVLRGTLQLGVDTDGSERSMSNMGRFFAGEGTLEVQNDTTHTDATFAGGEITFWSGTQHVVGTTRFSASSAWLRNNSALMVDQGASARLRGTLRSSARPIYAEGDLLVDGLLLLGGKPTSGRLVVAGDGSLTLAGRIVGANLDLQMPLTIQRAGSLELATLGEGNSTRVRQAITNLGAIDIATGEMWTTTSGAIVNSGVIRKSGGASVSISLPVSMVQGQQGTPEIEVLAGTLTIEGDSLASAGIIDVQDGTLNLSLGTGTFNNSGRVMLGSSALLALTGRFVNSGEVVSAMTSDSFGRITVSRQLSLPGGSLRAVFEGDGFEAGQQRMVITSASRVGTFAEFLGQGLPAPLTASAQHVGTGVMVLVAGA